MKLDISERVTEIALRLTEELSVTETSGENDASEKVYELFSEMNYYKENPQDLRYVYVPEDELERKSVLAILRGKKKPSNKAIVLIGHTDSVGISDYGEFKEYANRPLDLTRVFNEIKENLSDEIKRDIESGDYIFGRGIFDMKMGDAIIIGLMEHISKNLEDFEGNLIFAAVCDEETNSKGMLSVVPELVKIKEKEGFEYLGLIDTDYMTDEYPGDENKYVYIGAVGKLMPSFYVVGSETHVGEAFNGLDSNELAAAIVSQINMSTDYCDVAEGEVSLPPLSLKMRDLKTEYSVQTAKTSHVFFNYATHKITPDEVLAQMLDAAELCFDRVISKLNEEYKKYCKMAGMEWRALPWQSNVLSYDELYDEVKEELGDELDKKLEAYEEKLLKNAKIDEREHSLKMVEYLHSLWSNKNPVIVVYFTPPYYPHIYVEGKNELERNILRAVEDAVNTTDTNYKLKYKKFFPYIADLSYASAPKDDKIISALKLNMPGFGKKYDLPLKDMQKLDLPVLNIGSYGKDAHKWTERVHIDYSTKVVPNLLYKTIKNLL